MAQPVFVDAGAVLTLEKGCSLGDRSIVNVRTSVRIGAGTQISWQCQILDTDFHEVFNEDGVARPSTAAIEIGESVQDPAGFYDNNVSGTISLLLAAQAAGVPPVPCTVVADHPAARVFGV